jgi:heme/copper-type cytochrome/quinol oxidase subunit 3
VDKGRDEPKMRKSGDIGRIFWTSIMSAILMFAFLMLVLFTCEARADWYATQSLVPGEYMLIETDLYKSAQLAFNKAMHGEALIAETKIDMTEIVFGIKINVTKEINVNGLLK